MAAIKVGYAVINLTDSVLIHTWSDIPTTIIIPGASLSVGAPALGWTASAGGKTYVMVEFYRDAPTETRLQKLGSAVPTFAADRYTETFSLVDRTTGELIEWDRSPTALAAARAGYVGLIKRRADRLEINGDTTGALALRVGVLL